MNVLKCCSARKKLHTGMNVILFKLILEDGKNELLKKMVMQQSTKKELLRYSNRISKFFRS